MSEKLELMKEQHERLSSILASDLQPDVLQSERFENFKTLLENRSEILQQNIEKQDKIDILQNVLASKKMLLAVFFFINSDFFYIY